MKLGKVSCIGWIKYYYDKNSNPQTPGFVCSASHHKHRNHTCQLHQPSSLHLVPGCYTITDYEAKVRLLDNRDNGLDILQLAYMDHTMGMVIMLPRVKTNPL